MYLIFSQQSYNDTHMRRQEKLQSHYSDCHYGVNSSLAQIVPNGRIYVKLDTFFFRFSLYKERKHLIQVRQLEVDVNKNVNYLPFPSLLFSQWKSTSKITRMDEGSNKVTVVLWGISQPKKSNSFAHVQSKVSKSWYSINLAFSKLRT